MPPKLKRVVRLDSIPLKKAYYTEEGYLKDSPILTTTGIFEYTNDDGSIRRELRLPEEVFDKESLASYRAKPVVITHGAGLIDKDNVRDNAIGTILSDGRKDGDSVRADIVIYDTDAMKRSHLKELSLGYNLELDETPGEWRGEHYDAIQRNIRVNHLALVLEARAGEQARLNIDSRDRKPSNELTMEGVREKMRKTTKKARRNDGMLSPEEFAAALKEYKAMCTKRSENKTDADDEEALDPMAMGDPDTEKPVKAEDADDETGMMDEPVPVEDTDKQLQAVKDRRDIRDEEGDPKDQEGAMNIIAEQDEDIQILFDIIDTLMAQKDFTETKKDADDTEEPLDDEGPDAKEPGLAATGNNGDDDEEPENGLLDPDAEENQDEGEDDLTDEENQDEDEEENPLAEDGDDEDIPQTDKSEVGRSVMNIDSVDRIVRQRIQLGMMGEKLGLKGLENMKPYNAKKAVIKAVQPGIRLDGKSKAYINAAYDCACKDIQKMENKKRNRKTTTYQKRQMFNKDSASRTRTDSADAARQRMIDRQLNKKKEEK